LVQTRHEPVGFRAVEAIGWASACHGLKDAILAGIHRLDIRWRSSPLLFKRLEEEIAQLKSGDSYLRDRKRDGAEVFTIRDERHARYWMAQELPVLLVIRNSEGEIRWMEVRDWLKRKSDNGKKPVTQIIFEGERFDVMSVRRWRDKVLHGG